MRAQAKKQAETARPDQQEQIGELNESFSKALTALKKSRLAGGRGNALYALPWYMIIGPPGVGKSTALLRSGLRFPFSADERTAIRGVGGTRNCDWWFSDQAIILDTAGRYATEDDDRKEWTAFLQMLRKYRKKQPLNGLLVAVGVDQLLTASAEELEELAAPIRARVDQVLADLEVSVPVYLLLTKCDLVGGFTEFFGDLNRKTRAQVLGFTVPLDHAPADAERYFSEELDILHERIKHQGSQRLASVRPQERDAAFSFPLQFGSIKDPLSRFAASLLGQNPYRESVKLRGVYFCSGTQQGRPIDRVLSTLSGKLGLPRLSHSPSTHQQRRKRSYFLRDVFTQVLVPDQKLAGRSESSVRRGRRLHLATGAAVLLLGAAAIGVTSVVYANNAQLMRSTADLARRSRLGTPEDPKKELDGLRALERLGRRVDALRKYDRDGAPASLGLGFYQGRRYFKATERVFLKRARQIFVMRAGSELEAELNDAVTAASSLDKGLGSARARGKQRGASRDFDLLKTYLMVTSPRRLEIDFAANVLVEQWKKRLHPEVSSNSALLESIAVRYLAAIKDYRATWLERDNALVRKARQALRSRRALFCRITACDTPKRFADFRLRDALDNRIQSAIRTKAFVPGVYTRQGWSYVKKQLAFSRLKMEPWVVYPEQSTSELQAALKKRYFNGYIAAWTRFLGSVRVVQPKDAKAALRLLDTLITPQKPYRLLLSSLRHQTTLPLVGADKRLRVPRAGYMLLPRRLRRLNATARQTGLDKVVKDKLSKLQTPVSRAFRPLHVLVKPPKERSGQRQKAAIDQYLDQLKIVHESLANAITTDFSATTGSAVDTAVDKARHIASEILRGLPADFARGLRPLLLHPLQAIDLTVKGERKGRIDRTFRNVICTRFRNQLATHYPFNPNGSPVRMQDLTAYFGEKGTLWSYYRTRLAKSIIREGDRFTVKAGHTAPKGVVGYLNRAWRITRKLFPYDSATPRLRFDVRPQPAIYRVGRKHDVSEVVLEVEGKRRRYLNSPSVQWSFVWTGKTSKPTRLLIRGANGLRETLSFGGSFALMQLLAKGKRRKRRGWHRITWSFKGGEIKVPMDIRPARSQHPLFARLRLSCP
jgi:type VI secretion system protein ImpL